MPGFNIGGGNGLFSNSPSSPTSNKVVPRREHRFLFIIDELSRPVYFFLKKAERPQIKISVIETKFDQETAYWDGRHEWEPIALEFYDIDGADSSSDIYDWFNGVLDLGGRRGPTANLPGQYKKQCELQIYDGSGPEFAHEKWTLTNCWPISVDWGNLDYSSSEILTIKVQMRFDRAKREDSQSLF